jgi:signal transduction histidine kinase/CheY-like chemotaxis protein
MTDSATPTRTGRGAGKRRTDEHALGAALLTEPLTEAVRALAGVSPSGRSVADAQKAQLAVVHTLFGPKSCYFLQPDPQRRELQVMSVRGRNDERIRAVPLDTGTEAEAFTTRSVARAEGLTVIPLLSYESCAGCLALLEPKEEIPDTLALALGAQIAAAWELVTVRDDSERRNKDLQTAILGLKSLERNRDALLSNVSHDLKNPLTALKGHLALLVQGKLGELDERQLHALQLAERSADRLQRMVNDLLLLSRLQSGEMDLNQRPFGLKALVAEVLQGLASTADQARVPLNLARSPEVFVKGDRERLFEALSHMVEHAIHQSPAGKAVQVSIASSDGLASAVVESEGEESTPEQLEHLFDSFYRVRSPGGRSVIGSVSLPLVAKIAQLHGGKAVAHSQPGHGTTLVLSLPAFATALSPAKEEPAPRAGDILLVEDDRDCREVLQEVLEAEGYSVLSTAEVREALQVLEQSHPALVLLDLRLSNEDGRSVLHHIRKTPALAQIPVYVVSGSSEVGSLGAGVGPDRIDGYFEKPLQLERLLDTVAAVVRPARARV